MADRNAFTIANEIKSKLGDKDTPPNGDEIFNLFREAYSNLPKDEQLKEQVLQRLGAILSNAMREKKHPGLLSEEQKSELRAIRAAGGIPVLEETSSTLEDTQPAPVVEDESEAEIVDYEDVTNEGEETEESQDEGQEVEEPQNEGEEVEEPQDEGEEVEEPQDEGEEVEEPQNEDEEVEKSTFEKIKEASENIIINVDAGTMKLSEYCSDDVLEKAAEVYDKYPTADELLDLSQRMAAGDFSEFDEMGINIDDRSKVLVAACEYAQYVIDNEQMREAQNNILAGVTPNDKELNSLSFIEVKASKKTLRQAVESERPDVALMNPEDVLVANKYFVLDNKNAEDKAKCKEIIDGAMKTRLEEIIKDGTHISPNNAKALLAICAYCNDPALKGLVDDARRAIQAALEKYDKEHFGELSPDVLATNYANLQKDAKKYDPFTAEKSEGDAFDLGALVFTDENGNVITNKKEIKKYQESIVAVAREQACQSLVKNGDYTPEELNGAIKDATFRIITSSAPVQKDGKLAVNTSNLALSIANPQVENETFKTRVWQKFKNTKFAKAVKKCVDSVDKKLTERYGTKYTKAKSVLKFVGKLTTNVAKNTALYAAAGLVPGGTAVLMGYNLYKSWKAVGPQLKDKNKSLSQKVGVIAAAGITSAFTLAGMGASLGLGVQNLADAGVLSPEAISSTMSGIGKVSRMAIITGATMLPNAMEGLSLKIKQKRLDKALKEVENLKDKDGNPLSPEEKAKAISEIMQKQKVLKTKQDANLKEMATKGVGVLGGMVCAQLIAPVINEGIRDLSQKAEDALDAAKNIANDDKSNSSGGRDFAERPSPLKPEAGEKFEPEKSWEKMQDKYAFKDYDGDGKVDSPWSNEAVEARAEAESVERAPDDVAARMTAEHQANLDAAKAPGSSGFGERSSYDETLRHLEHLNDSRIEDNAQMAENLSEHFGDKASYATVACKMSPYALQAELGLDLPDGVKPTSYQMLNYLAEHELTPEQQVKFDQYIEKNFDGTRFMTENFPDWSKPAVQQNYAEPQHIEQSAPQPQSQPEVYAQPEVQAQAKAQTYTAQEVAPEQKTAGFRFDNVDQQSQQHQQPQQHQHQQPQQQYYQQHPEQYVQQVHSGMTPQDVYAAERGFVPCPEFSRGLDYNGSSDGTSKGYYGAYINPHDGKILFLPNDMTVDRGLISEMSIDDAKYVRYHEAHMYNRENGSYMGYGTRHLFPGSLNYGGAQVAYEASSSGHKFWDAINKINVVSQTVASVAGDVSRAGCDVTHLVHDIKSWGGGRH